MSKQNVFSLLLLCFAAPLVHATSFEVTVTDTLQSKTGFIAFDFLQGSPAPDNLATITNFATNATLSAATQTGSVTGSLVPGPLHLADTSFFNEWLQGVTYDTTISFVLTTGDATVQGGIPDSFSFFLLDDTRNPFATTDPTGADSLFSVDLNGPNTTLIVYKSTFATAAVSPVMIMQAPEPSSLTLFLLPLAAMALLRKCFFQTIKS